jgi:hypothetical protein
MIFVSKLDILLNVDAIKLDPDKNRKKTRNLNKLISPRIA